MKFHQAMRLLHIGEAVRRDGWAKGCLLLPRKGDQPQYMLSEIRSSGKKDRLITSEWSAQQEDIVATDWSLLDVSDLIGVYTPNAVCHPKSELIPGLSTPRNAPTVSAAKVEVVHTDKNDEEERISAERLMSHFVAAPILIECLKKLQETIILPKHVVDAISEAFDAYDRVRYGVPEGVTHCVIHDHL